MLKKSASTTILYLKTLIKIQKIVVNLYFNAISLWMVSTFFFGAKEVAISQLKMFIYHNPNSNFTTSIGGKELWHRSIQI